MVSNPAPAAVDGQDANGEKGPVERLSVATAAEEEVAARLACARLRSRVTRAEEVRPVRVGRRSADGGNGGRSHYGVKCGSDNGPDAPAWG